MNEPLPILLESSMMIAWDYLERTGELGDPEIASRVLLDSIEGLMRNGERRTSSRFSREMPPIPRCRRS